MIFLVDHNLEGQALLLSEIITGQGWQNVFPIDFVALEDLSLPINSSDRVIWRFAQARQMILLTANRRMKGEDSLEQVLREENTPTSLPVITIANADRVLNDSDYREECVNRLLEIALFIENYYGTRRLFIP